MLQRVYGTGGLSEVHDCSQETAAHQLQSDCSHSRPHPYNQLSTSGFSYHITNLLEADARCHK